MSDNKNNVDKNIFADEKMAEIWFEKNWKKVVAIVVCAIVVGMAVFASIYLKKQNDSNMMKAFAAAETAELAALLEKSPNAAGSASARIRLADALIEKKDYAGAKAQFQTLANDASAAAELRSRAKLGIAACDELSGNKKAAAESYMRLSNDSSVPSRVRDEAAFHAGRLFVAVADLRGREILKKLADSPMDSAMANPWKAHAAALLKNLK